MPTFVQPHIHQWSRREYARMAEVGFFTDKRVELIEGQIIVLSPMGSMHATAVALVAKALESIFSTDGVVRWQMPFVAGEYSEPEPDIAVVTGTIRDYRDQHPSHALLLVEVADTSLTYDRETKASLYARAGVAEYWIINLVDQCVEVYRQPHYDAQAPFDFSYAPPSILVVGDQLAPLARPEAIIAVADLLP